MCSAFDEDYYTLELDENEMKFENVESLTPDETPLKDNGVIIPRIRKRPKKSSLIIKPLSEMSPTQKNENELTCPVYVINPSTKTNTTEGNENDLTCSVCGKVSASKHLLREHIRTRHKGERKREGVTHRPQRKRWLGQGRQL